MSEQPPTPPVGVAPPSVSEMQTRAEEALRQIAPVTDELGRRFADAGEEIALVGGPVRDAMLGRRQLDLDFTTSARPETTERLLKGWADAIWDMGRDFGTIGCRKGEWTVEITTYRSEEYDATSRKPDVDYGDSLVADLQRRDFSVNSMALTVPDRGFEDPFGGLVDLANRTLRTPGRPEDSFSDDPLRMMRAARFAAQLGFEVAPEVVAAMTEMASRIEIISAERVRDELVKLVCAPHPRLGLLLPRDFLPRVQGSDVARPLSDWVLRAAIRDASSWLPNRMGSPWTRGMMASALVSGFLIASKAPSLKIGQFW